MMMGDEEFYGYKMHKILNSKGIVIGITRLYQTLNVMEKNGLLVSKFLKSPKGPDKKIYKIIKKGTIEREKVLLNSIKTIHRFYGEYLKKLPSQKNIFKLMANLITVGLKENDKIGFIIQSPSKMQEIMIRKTHEKAPKLNIVIIKPRPLQVSLSMDNLYFTEGSYNSIPMKDNYFDSLVVIGVPKKDSIETAITEWHRTIKQNGRLTIMTPTILIEEYEDPIEIGKFIEKYEHGSINRKNIIGNQTLKLMLKNFFNKVEERKIIHMSIFLAHT